MNIKDHILIYLILSVVNKCMQKVEGNFMYPICKKGSAWISILIFIGLVWGGWKVKLLFPATELELHKLSIALRLNPSPSSWKWCFEP